MIAVFVHGASLPNKADLVLAGALSGCVRGAPVMYVWRGGVSVRASRVRCVCVCVEGGGQLVMCTHCLSGCGMRAKLSRILMRV